MKPLINFLFCLIFLCSLTSNAQNAPVTTGSVVYDHGSAVVVPIKVANFADIGAISLTMDYDITVVQVTGVSFNSNLPGFTADWITTPGRIVMGWTGSSGVSLSDNAHLADIIFTGLVAGETDLAWVDNGISCQYSKYDNGTYTILNDSPTGDYYKNGHIAFQRSGPQTVAPIFTASPNQVICIPVKVNQFTDIGSISLTLDYDPAVMTFQSIASTTIPGSWLLTGQAVTSGRVIVGGFGPGITMPDGSVLFEACFMYHGGATSLSWYDGDGISCEYADGATLNPLYDLPQPDFYINGWVGPSLPAPRTFAPVYVASPNQVICIPIKADQLTNIGSISLTLDYDPAVMTFQSIASTTIPGSWFLTGQAVTPGRLIVGGYGSGFSLPDGSVLFEACFLYHGGATTLSWYDADGISCEYADAATLNPLYDQPQSNFYINGWVGPSRPSPQTIAPNYTASGTNQVICIPITVSQFLDIGSISLTLDYDPNVLTFQCISSSAIPGTWFFDGQAVNPGRLIVGGYGPGIHTIPDGDVLFYACFYYHGGTSTLTWYDTDGISCEFADATTLDPLSDLPQNVYYIDGLVTSLSIDFLADLVNPPKNTTVNFTDLTSGAPTAWEWSFDRPADVVYCGGTNCHTQHPKVKFLNGGHYNVSLTVHKSSLVDSKTKDRYVLAGISGFWIGEVSSEWNLFKNWDNWLVPDASTDIIIPASASFWPVFNGDLTIGIQCKSITLIDILSQLTINGNFIIH